MKPFLLRLVPAAVLAVLVGGCGQRPDEGAGPVVVATVHPLADIARQIAGDAAEVRTLLPPGVTPHGFSMTPSRLQTLRGAELVISVGRGLDPWAERALERTSSDAEVIELAETLEDGHADHDEHAEHADHAEHEEADVHAGHDHHDHAGPNPHLWLDPVRMAAFARHLGEALTERFPDHAGQIERNTAELLASLDKLDAEYRDQLTDVRKEMVTFHNAFDPLAERYGLEVVAHLTPIELGHGGEVTPARLRQAIEAVREHDLPVIYAEPQLPGSAAQALQQETDVEILRLDPLGHPGVAGYETYQAMMRSNLAALVEGQTK